MCGEQKAEIPLFTFIACRHLGLSSPLEICWQIKPVTFINEIHQRLNIIFAQYLKQVFYFSCKFQIDLMEYQCTENEYVSKDPN